MLAVAANLLVVPPAFAADKDAARQAYEEGRRRYDLNEFEAALESFKRAYLAYEDPVFLFNIAQCHRQLGHQQDAINFYRSYLRNLPNAPNADEVKGIVAKLQAEVDQQDQERARAAAAAAAEPKPPTPASAPVTTLTATAPPPHPQTPVYKKWWLWTVVGVVAAGAATGVALAVTSQRTEPTFMPVTR